MTIESKLGDAFLHVVVEGKKQYLLCGCCDRYIRTTEMNLEQYRANTSYCPQCLRAHENRSIYKK